MIGLWSDWRLKKGGWRPAVVVDPVAIRNVPDRIHEVFEVFNHTSTTIGRIRKQGLVLLLEPFIVRGTWMFETCCREAILWWSSRNPSSTLRGTFGSTDYYGDAFDHFCHCTVEWWWWKERDWGLSRKDFAACGTLPQECVRLFTISAQITPFWWLVTDYGRLLSHTILIGISGTYTSSSWRIWWSTSPQARQRVSPRKSTSFQPQHLTGSWKFSAWDVSRSCSSSRPAPGTSRPQYHRQTQAARPNLQEPPPPARCLRGQSSWQESLEESTSHGLEGSWSVREQSPLETSSACPQRFWNPEIILLCYNCSMFVAEQSGWPVLEIINLQIWLTASIRLPWV